MSRQPLPSDPQLEADIISLVFTTNGSVFLDDLNDITSEFFEDARCLLLFSHCRRVHDKGKFSLPLVRASLQAAGSYDEEYLLSLAEHKIDPDTGPYLTTQLRAYATVRRIARLGQTCWTEARSLEVIEPDEVLKLANKIVGEAGSLDALNTRKGVKEIAAGRERERIQKIREGRAFSEKTGIKVLDQYFVGMRRGKYCGVAGRPATGKSALMEMCATALMIRNVPCTVFAQDQSPGDMITRIACRLCEVPVFKLEQGLLDDAQVKDVLSKIDMIEKSCMQIHYVPGIMPEHIPAIMKADRAKHGSLYFFFDQYGRIRGEKKEDPRLYLGRASGYIRDEINAMNGYFMGLAHLNRGAVTDRPGPEHVKDCDQIFGDVDELLLLSFDREDDAAQASPDWRETIFTIGKNRNGPEGTETVNFYKPYMEFQS